VRRLADNTPDLNLAAVAITGETIWCFERNRADGDAVVALDGAGSRRRWPIPSDVKSGHVLVTPDGARVAHTNPWGQGGILDTRSGQWTALQGGEVDLDRDHDDGMHATMSADGSVLLGVARRGAHAHAWRVADGTSLPAPWRDPPHTGAFLLGNLPCIVRAASITAGEYVIPVEGKPTIVAIDDRRLAMVTPPGAIEIHDVIDGKVVDRVSWPAKLTGRTHLRAGDGILAASGGGSWVAVIDLE
jgi:hypothetical protein